MADSESQVTTFDATKTNQLIGITIVTTAFAVWLPYSPDLVRDRDSRQIGGGVGMAPT